MSAGGKGVVKERITEKLTRGLSPLALDVVDDSHRHAGHHGHHPEGESHFSIKVVSEAFVGKSRVERHRLINALLAEELASRVHALAISAKTPEEARAP